jgi:hypothetical protein
MVRARARAWALSVMPGNNRRNSTAADSSSPLIEGGADHPGRSFLGPQWPDNMGSVSWRWLCRLKWASSEKAGIFAFAFQSVAVPQTGPSIDWGIMVRAI